MYGVKCPRTEATVQSWLSGATIAANALVDLGTVQAWGLAAEREPWELEADRFPLLGSAGAAGLLPGGRLAPSGPLKSAGTGGKDIGVDFMQLGHPWGRRQARPLAETPLAARRYVTFRV